MFGFVQTKMDIEPYFRGRNVIERMCIIGSYPADDETVIINNQENVMQARDFLKGNSSGEQQAIHAAEVLSKEFKGFVSDIEGMIRKTRSMSTARRILSPALPAGAAK
jgi:hypothetical protein